MEGEFDRKLLKKLIDRVGGVYVYSFDKGRNIYVNKTYTALTGYSPQQIRSMSSSEFASLFHLQDLPRIREHMKKLRSLPADEFLDIEYRFRKANGSWMWCLSKDSVFNSEGRRASSFIGTFLDITERKLNEHRLRKSEKRYKKILKHAPAAIYEISFREKRFKQVNDCMCRMLGFSRSELLNMDPFDLLDDEGKHLFQERIDMWLSGAKPSGDVEFEVKTKDGRKLTAHLNATLIKDGEGRPQGAYVIATDVTQRRQAEEGFESQRMLFQSVFDHIPVLLVLWDPRLQYFTLNKHAEDVLGWTTAEANEHDFMTNVYPDPDYRAKIGSFMQSLSSSWRQFNCTTKHGHEIPVNWTNIKLKDDTMIGIGVDLRRTQELTNQLRKTQEIAKVGGWSLDLMKDKLTWTEETYKIFGVQPDNFKPTYEDFLKLIHPQDRGKVEDAHSKSLAEGSDGYEIEHRIINQQKGETRYVLGKCEHAKKPSGKIALSNGIIQDITARKQGELRRQALLESLRRVSSKTRTYAYELNAIFKSVTEPLMVLDRNGRVEKTNKAAVDSLALNPVGYTLLNLVERLKITDEEGRQFKPQHVTEKVLGGEALEDVKIKFTDAEDHKKTVLLSAAPVKTDNEIRLSVLIWYDMTEIEQMENLRKQLIRDLSHQLKTPLSIISMASNMIEEESGEPTVYENVKMIQRNTKNMSKLITSILSLSELESGKITLKTNKFNLVRNLKTNIREVKPILKNKKLKLNLEAPTSLTIRSDEHKINEIMENLLHNAIKYTDKGEINVTLEKICGYAVLSVTDTGVGLTKKQLKKIFTRFYKADPSVEGSGLGLNIVTENLKLLGGEIKAKSRGRGKGSTFKVFIPLKKKEEKENEKNNTNC
ncbi:MAG: PAS domain S-box protein [Candidatus Altiarchaeales archaeon]|nr:PAS domain S-box protein [Candidatus Altiarchaeales archaeon]